MSEIFWTSLDDFTKAPAYVEAVVGSFSLRHEAVRLTLEKEGKPPWPRLPPAVASGQTPPVERLRALLTFSRSLVPVRDGVVTVWTLFPTEIEDPAAYAALFRDVLKHEFPFPWCHHLRVVLREDPAQRPLRAALQDAPRVQWFDLDLSLPALERSMEEEVADPAVPLDQRLGTLLVMAGVDSAYKRYPAAREKYTLLVHYHRAKGNHQLAALALNGLGEVHQRTGDLAQAGRFFEAALEPASAAPVPSPVALNVVMNLAALRAEQGRWADAEAYYDSGEQLGMLLRNPAAKFQCLEHRGLAQYRQQKIDQAVATWTAGADLAEKLGETAFCRSLLDRLEDHYRRSRQGAEVDRVRARLAALPRPAPQTPA
jgi:hypothetical protein